MPKYYEFKIAGYYLYFTSFCIIECMHVHASDRRLTESGSAKFFKRMAILFCKTKEFLQKEKFTRYRLLLRKIIKICILNGLSTVKMGFIRNNTPKAP